jgi:hypothetical protein
VPITPAACRATVEGLTPNLYARLAPRNSEVVVSFFGHGSAIVSIKEIKRSYPDEWVAVAVLETDADGFAAKGEVLAHAAEEHFVWSAIRLGDVENPVYVFFTGARRTRPARH